MTPTLAAPRRNSALPGPLWIAALGVMALLAALWHVAGSQPVVSLERLAAFHETAPFQHRALVPLLVATAHAVTGLPVPGLFFAAEWLGWWLLLATAAIWCSSLAGTRSAWTARLVGSTVAACVGAQLLAPVRFRTFAGDTSLGDVNGLLHGATRIAALPNVFFPWDVWSATIVIALVAVLLSLRQRMTRRRILGWAAGFLVSCLNRETSVLLIPLSLWAFSPWVPKGRLALLGIAEAIVWGVVLWGIAHVTGAPPNPKSTFPGGAYEWYLWTNVATLRYPLYVVTGVLPFAAGAWLLLAVRWRDIPVPAMAVLALYAVPAAAAAAAFGILLEARVFTEAAAAVWMATVLTFDASRRVAAPDAPG